MKVDQTGRDLPPSVVGVVLFLLWGIALGVLTIAGVLPNKTTGANATYQSCHCAGEVICVHHEYENGTAYCTRWRLGGPDEELIE